MSSANEVDAIRTSLFEAVRRGLSQPLVSARLSPQVRVVLHEFVQGLNSRECPNLSGVGPPLGELVEARGVAPRPRSGSSPPFTPPPRRTLRRQDFESGGGWGTACDTRWRRQGAPPGDSCRASPVLTTPPDPHSVLGVRIAQRWILARLRDCATRCSTRSRICAPGSAS